MRVSCVMCLLLVLSAGTASADPITITFDEISPGAYLTNTYQGIFFGSHSSEVSTGRFQVLSTPSATSQPNAAAPAAPISGGPFNGTTFTDIGGFFVINGSQSWPVDFLSLDVIGTAADQPEPWVLNLYNFENQIIESRRGTTDMTLTFARPDIFSFVLSGTGREMIDTLTFTPSPTPEPATMMMISTGLAGVALRLRRRRNAFSAD